MTELHLNAWIKEEYNRRSTNDRRKRVDWYVVEYKDNDGVTYRKSFEFAPGTPFKSIKAWILPNIVV